METINNLTQSQTANKQAELFLRDVVAGLTNTQKTLPSKYFYDKKGSQLFEKICELDEYYVTRTELDLLQQAAPEIAQCIGADAAIIEPGSGAGQKIRLLLSALDAAHSYTAIDISQEILFRSAQELGKDFPHISMQPIMGDFTQVFNHPELFHHSDHHKKVIFFPGSTIGNFNKHEAIDFLSYMASVVGDHGGLLIGVDLIKDRQVLLNAYNDRQGLTAAFNLNLLNRINQELNADFNLDQFDHKAIFNEHQQRIEMHLISQKNQLVTLNEKPYEFAMDETIHTESSHKYSVDSFIALAQLAGFEAVNHWTDSKNWFGLFYFEVNASEH